MKSLLILIALVSIQAQAAFDVCQFEDTVAFDEAVDAKKVTLVKQTNDHKKWTAIEKKMIHETIKSPESKITQFEALRYFGDYYEDSTEEGSNAGEIQYFRAGNFKFALVHYWPGDNEVGAFIELGPKNQIKILATVSDQWIECKSR